MATITPRGPHQWRSDPPEGLPRPIQDLRDLQGGESVGYTRSLASVSHLDFQEFADERRDEDIAPSTIGRDLSVIQAMHQTLDP
ncbi:hypothetical protein [Castellaniella sp.]|uniref:hypothetical protein n=1 Tax=Castellaniella sp. TaxID=1955812 RepID=UPI003A9166E8